MNGAWNVYGARSRQIICLVEVEITFGAGDEYPNNVPGALTTIGRFPNMGIA